MSKHYSMEIIVSRIISEPRRVCGRQNTGSKDAHFLIPEPVTITFFVKGDFIGVVKLNILR